MRGPGPAAPWCVVERPAPIPGPALLQGFTLSSMLQTFASVEPAGATLPHAGQWVPALPWDAPRPTGSAAAASLHSGPHLFRAPVCGTGDSRFSQRCDRRQAISALPAFINRLCCCRPVSRRPPSIPPSFRRSPAPRRHPWAASGQPSAETRLFGSEKSANQQLNEFTARISATFLIYFDLGGTLFISGTWGRGRQIINTSPSGPACPIYDL